jgi:hypothetical protein
MAAGRENPLVNEYFVENHPVVLRLIRIVLEEAVPPLQYAANSLRIWLASPFS